ncbi:hypothetical protein [Halanaerobium sp. DL-01]|nr:hypothetical protein [Halanaerobium sp. DL-01]
MENRLERFSNNDIKEMFKRYSDKPDHTYNVFKLVEQISKSFFVVI